VVDALELLALAAATTGAVATLAGAVWWLVGPRVRQGLERAVQRVLDPHLTAHDKRLARLEDGLADLLHPVTLLELRDLLDLLREHAAPAPFTPRRTRPARNHHHREEDTA
jgi:hypothetical protein